jgi:hypothetical protein
MVTAVPDQYNLVKHVMKHTLNTLAYPTMDNSAINRGGETTSTVELTYTAMSSHIGAGRPA